MMGYGMYAGGGVEFFLMKFFMFVLFVGVVLFFIWAAKALDKKQLKKLVAGLLIVGAVGLLEKLTVRIFEQLEQLEQRQNYETILHPH